VNDDSAAVVIRRAVASDATDLAGFASRTFFETFALSTSAANMSAYLIESYSPEIQRREIEDPERATFVAHAGGLLIGYAQLTRGPEPDCVHARPAIELQRLYVAPDWHGRGVAIDLMGECVRAALQLRAVAIWLGVWEHNVRARTFYMKQGFVQVGTHLFNLGTDAQTDLIMERSIVR